MAQNPRKPFNLGSNLPGDGAGSGEDRGEGTVRPLQGGPRQGRPGQGPGQGMGGQGLNRGPGGKPGGQGGGGGPQGAFRSARARQGLEGTGPRIAAVPDPTPDETLAGRVEAAPEAEVVSSTPAPTPLIEPAEDGEAEVARQDDAPRADATPGSLRAYALEDEDGEEPVAHPKKKKNNPGQNRPATPAAPPPEVVVRPIAGPAVVRKRHWGGLVSFLLAVVIPIAGIAAYLWLEARDQYASTVGFSVRTQQAPSAIDMVGGLGALGALGGGGASDADILYQYILSQDLVAALDKKLDLRTRFSKAWPDDPVFAFDPKGSIEDLVDYWTWAVSVSYDGATGLITLRVNAFDPQDAQQIAEGIYAESTRMINELSAVAQADATRFAKEELDQAQQNLTRARQALTAFRMQTQIVDPSADVQGQMGLLNTLQAQLAAALIDQDMLTETAKAGDPRLVQGERRIAVIEKRIEEERKKFGAGGQGPGGEDYATTVAEFERLTVEQGFAEEVYKGALVAYDQAVSNAQQQSRYLAAHIRPTIAERSVYPQRWVILTLSGFFLIMIWSIGMLIYYSVRDRR